MVAPEYMPKFCIRENQIICKINIKNVWKWKLILNVSESSVVPNSLQPDGLYSSWNSPGQNIGVGSLSLFQGIFLTQESNQGLLHCRWILYQLSYEGSSNMYAKDMLIHGKHCFKVISKGDLFFIWKSKKIFNYSQKALWGKI